MSALAIIRGDSLELNVTVKRDGVALDITDAEVKFTAKDDLGDSDEDAASSRIQWVVMMGGRGACGDGWHRVAALESNGKDAIEANLHRGGRVDALKHALAANAVHGRRRTNADKRRCVEIALAEFPKMSSNAISKMCGVGNHLVDAVRGQLGETPSSPQCAVRTGADGKDRPAHRDIEPAESEVDHSPDNHPQEESLKKDVEVGPPCIGLQYARMAVLDLEQIRSDDSERKVFQNTTNDEGGIEITDSENGLFKVLVAPEDTVDLSIQGTSRNLVYDLQITLDDGRVFTIDSGILSVSKGLHGG